MADRRPSAIRFWEKVNLNGETVYPELGQCWEWTGARTAPGWHGVCSFDSRRVVAHRAAWMMAHGTIPDGLLVLHRCDNPPCVRVDHLFLGTYQDNSRDAATKGRLGQTKHKTHCVHGHEYTPENTYRGPRNGRRQCVTCRRDGVRRSWHRHSDRYNEDRRQTRRTREEPQ